VLVGLHAPPLNPKGDEYPNYFRETARAAVLEDDQIVGYLARRDLAVSVQAGGGPLGGGVSLPALRTSARRLHPEWFTGGEHFKRRRQGDLLDAGVSRGEAQAFLEVCAGAEGRPADLVLFGHVHRHVEYRLSWDAGAGEVRYHTDFYSASPRAYYPMRLLMQATPVLVDVFAGAPPQGGPSRVRDHRGPWPEQPRVEVAPYAQPLAESADPRAWWGNHRPLLLQTAPLGPTEANNRPDLALNPTRPGPAFRGARLISVRDDVIVRITSLSASAIALGAATAVAAGG
jgi:hypothetical protein